MRDFWLAIIAIQLGLLSIPLYQLVDAINQIGVTP